MYIPASFREDRLEAMHALMRTHPLAMLIVQGRDGLQAAPVPFILYAGEGEHGTLRAHVARANPLWRELDGAGECLVVFQGPDGYVTPSWYASKATTHKVVPTWNYATVQARGRAAAIDDAAWLRRQLDDLTRCHEAGRPQPWSVDDAPADYLAAQMKALVGIEIPIARIEGKWKMSQNREMADRQGVVDGLRAADDPHRNAPLADAVEGRIEGQAAGRLAFARPPAEESGKPV